jgi:ribosomal protein S18 acetylase RimI-like enzyme
VNSSLDYRLNPPLSNADLNVLFSTGWPSWQTAPDTSDWQPVLRHGLVHIGAFESDRLVGFVNVAWDGRDHAFLLDPRVHPDHRNRGIGTELVRLAAVAARDAGCEWLHVDYDPELAPFYEIACGFTPTPASLLRLQ